MEQNSLIIKRNDIEAVLKSEKDDNKILKSIYDHISIYQKYLPVHQNRPSFYKKSYEEKYTYKLKMFKNADDMLKKYGLTDRKKIADFLDKYELSVRRTSELTYNSENIQKDLIKLEVLKKVIKEIKEPDKEQNINLSKDYER